jgi:hypothetical protein
LVRTVLVAGAGLASVYFAKLGLFAAVGTFVAWASLPKWPRAELKREHGLLVVAALASAVGLCRFLIVEAIPGIVQGGTRFTEQRAVSRLRELLFAEDTARRRPVIDPDHDGIGSAALLGELTGELLLRGQSRIEVPRLEGFPKLTETKLGPASEIGGYFVIVCLPKVGGGFSATPGDSFDDEQAERRFLAYAWPSGTAPGLKNAVMLDEHENIELAPARPGLRFGPDSPPSCDDAVAEQTRSAWQPWQHKRPRKSLPGEAQ